MESCETNKCRLCLKIKNLSEFKKNYQGKSLNFCLACFNLKARERYLTRKEDIKQKRIAREKEFLINKKCGCCGETKQREEFGVSRETASGLQSYCKVCINKNRATIHDKERVKNGKKKRVVLTEEERIERKRKAAKERYLKNKEFYLKKNQNYRKLNKRKYSPEQKLRMKEVYDLYRKTPKAKIANNCRRRIKNGLKGVCKSKASQDLIGISFEDLKIYLESLFLPGMSWENYGLYGWHIDHVKSISSFDLTDIEQQKACFHYTNLQPLWAKDNLKKGNR